MEGEGLSYKKAGVDIDAANKSVNLIKSWVEKTRRPEVLTGIGAFGGFFALDMAKYKHPVLISGTDGVGTKLMIAQMMDIHDTVGIDLVAMCVNDILVHGAEPLFFLDYIAVGQLIPEKIELLVKGVSQGCLQAGCSLIGGETAEMPGMYSEGEYDLAGFAVGAVEKEQVLNGSRVADGDIVVALPSTGLHSNGYSLARRVLLEDAHLKLDSYIDELSRTLGEELLTPTRIYVSAILPLLDAVEIKAMAHITGGGLAENLSRSIPAGLGAVIDSAAIEIRPIFDLIQKLGRVKNEEMFRTFNMGVGFVLIIAPHQLDKALKWLRDKGEKCKVIGRITVEQEGVVIK